MANKVEFGISKLHVGTYSVSDEGVVSLGTPYAQKGAVHVSVEPNGDTNKFYADNVVYYSSKSAQGFEGEIEVAKFDDDFKTKFLNAVELDDGGIADIKGAAQTPVYFMFETDGDAEKRRVIVYNVTLGDIQREYNTIEEDREPVTEKIDITVTGDNKTGITKVVYAPEASGYDSMFTTPPVPALPGESS